MKFLPVGLVVACAIALFSATSICAANDDDAAQKDKMASFMDQMAGTVYKLAWPTATYRSWSFADVKSVAGGYDLVIKLSGLSAFDDSDLWLKLGFALRGDGIKNVWVVDHNAFLVPPFKTSQTLAQAAVEMTKQYARTPATNAAQPAVTAALAAPPVGAKRAGATCIDNPTDMPLKFIYHWGDGPWQKYQLNAHMSVVLSWAYEPATPPWSPDLEIEYDDNLADGYTPQRYLLVRNQLALPAVCEDAKKYEFTLEDQAVELHTAN